MPGTALFLLPITNGHEYLILSTSSACTACLQCAIVFELPETYLFYLPPYAFIYDKGTISGDYANAQGWVIFDTEVDYVITADGIGSYHGSHVITDAEWEAAYVKIVMTP